MKRIGIGLLLWLGLVSSALAQALYNPSGGGTPGGSNTQVQYNTAGSFGGITGATSNGTTLTLVAPILGVATGTSLALTDAANPSASTLSLTGASALTTNQPLINGTQTWSAAGVTFTALKINVTTTASAAASLLIDAQVASVSQFRVDKGGGVYVPVATGAFYVNTGGTAYVYGRTGTVLTFGAAGALAGEFNAAAFQLSSTGSLNWSSSSIGSASDVSLFRDAANTLALRNGATGQTFNIYNTFTDASNYERVALKWSASVAYLITEGGGTGVARAVGLQGNNIELWSAGVRRWNISGGGDFLAQTDNTYDIGASGATRPRNLYVGTSGVFGGQLTVSGIATDTAHTDATVCEDTTTHQFYSGSGTLGICLGTSSLRFKDRIAPLQPGLAQIVGLRPITYHYKPGYGDSSRKLYGFAAEQVNEVLPELVSLDTAGRPNSIDWAGLVPVLVNAIQEQQREINALRRAIK